MLIRSKCVKCGKQVVTSPTDKRPLCVKHAKPIKKPNTKPGMPPWVAMRAS